MGLQRSAHTRPWRALSAFTSTIFFHDSSVPHLFFTEYVNCSCSCTVWIVMKFNIFIFWVRAYHDILLMYEYTDSKWNLCQVLSILIFYISMRDRSSWRAYSDTGLSVRPYHRGVGVMIELVLTQTLFPCCYLFLPSASLLCTTVGHILLQFPFLFLTSVLTFQLWWVLSLSVITQSDLDLIHYLSVILSILVLNY